MLTHQLGKEEYIIALLYYLMCLIPPQVFPVIVNMLTLILLDYNVKDKSATLEKIIDICNVGFSDKMHRLSNQNVSD